MRPSIHGHLVWRLIYGLLALIGALAVLMAVVLAMEPDEADGIGGRIYQWLATRHSPNLPEPAEDVTKRVVALNLDDLTASQAAVAQWLSTKYRVAPEPIAALVKEAHRLSHATGLPANLILAVASIESNFHPYVQSGVGAQGLMQVMPKIHAKRYEPYGGKMSAFDPITNLRVGASVLADCIKLKNGSVDEGLKYYFAGGIASNGEFYLAKVRREQQRLDQVAEGRVVPVGAGPQQETDPP